MSDAVPSRRPSGAVPAHLPSGSVPAPDVAIIVTTLRRVPFAHVAAETFLRAHPSSFVHVVVVDDRFGETARRPPRSSVPSTATVRGIEWRSLGPRDVGPRDVGPRDVGPRDVGPRDVGPRDVVEDEADSGRREIARLRLSFDADTLVRVVRPGLVARALSSTSANVVISLADDAFVRAPLTELTAIAEHRGFAVCRVRTAVAPMDGRLPDRREELRSGAFDDTTFAVSTAGEAIAWEWATLVGRSPLDDIEYLDPAQVLWLDTLVSTYAPDTIGVLASSLASYRNLDLGTSNAPVFRFPDFNAHRPWQLSTLAGAWPRVLLSAHTEVSEIVAAYSAAVLNTSTNIGGEPISTLPNGHPIDAAMRLAYRRALVAAEREKTMEPPNPFLGQSEEFVRWLAEPVPGSILSRYLHALRTQRADLRAAFGEDDGALQQWADTKALGSNVWIPREFSTGKREREVGRPVVHKPVGHKPGINVVGLLSAQLGVGEHGRLTLATVEASGLAHAVIDHDATVSERDPDLVHRFSEASNSFEYDVDLLLVNADQTREVLQRFGRNGAGTTPTIGLWAWEVQTFPQRMHGAFACVDEVWVLSDFVRDALQPSASEHSVRVHTFPMRYPTPARPLVPSEVSAAIHELGVPTNLPFFAFAFDYFSVAERKQPWALVEAFRRAFPTPTPGGPRLVLKSMNHKYAPLDRERLLHAIRGRQDIILIEHYLPAVQRDALISGAAAYVSLHRAEGFGLTLAEAMSVGTPVIATDWSGNRQFMTPENSFLVPSQPVPIANDTAVYAGLGSWAEPDLDVAAELLQRVLDDPAEARARAERALADVRAHNTSGNDVAFLFERLRAVRQQGKQLQSVR